MSQHSDTVAFLTSSTRGGAPQPGGLVAATESRSAPGLLSSLKQDLPAGLVVFLVALPLCLGIALASGAPLISGIIAGVCGGLVIAPLGGSRLSVSGPAAGLTVIVLNAIQALGSFPVFLMAVVLAGVLQVALGFLKAGAISSYFPSSVIKGMLAAIGIILIMKQTPVAVGYDAARVMHAVSGPLGLLAHLTPGAVIIGLTSLAVLVAFSRPALAKIAVVPAQLLVVVLGVLLGRFFAASPTLALASKQFVALPAVSGLSDLASLMTLPDFSALANPKVYMVAATLAIIASLETLLSVEAVDKIDPQKIASDPNRELKAQGLGNMLSGLIGGLPITAVIVRSAANVNAGARTKLSAVIHGVLLVVAVLALPGLLNMIPLAALAAILLHTGYKLASPALIKSMARAGFEQFIPFAVTIAAILATDLLKGIAIGMVVGVFFILRGHYGLPYFFHREPQPSGEKIRIVLCEHVSFLNKARIRGALSELPAGSSIEIDGTGAKIVDRDVLELIHDFAASARDKRIQVEIKGLREPQQLVGAH
jgi:MFS superfamily sulfate permease-like transporter